MTANEVVRMHIKAAPEKETEQGSENTHVGAWRRLPVLLGGEGLRRHVGLDEREAGLHPLRHCPAFGVHHHPLPIPPEACARQDQCP